MHGRFITTIEWASFYKILVPTRDDPEEKALIDCSWLTVYDVKGDVYKQFMIPDKLVETAIVSEDGNYMICETMSSWTNIAGELYYEYNGFLIINLLTNNIIYLNDDILKNDAAEILYADSYFQIYFSTGYRVYLNPEKKTYSFFRYYIKDTRGKKQVWGKSFEHYLGLRESLEQMQVVEY